MEAAPGKPDNHFLDCLVGCAVGASMLGCQLLGGKKPDAAGSTKRRARRAAVSYL